MNWDHIKVDWTRVQRKIKSRWGRITDADLKSIAGDWDALVGSIRQHYGYGQEHVERDVDDFLRRI